MKDVVTLFSLPVAELTEDLRVPVWFKLCSSSVKSCRSNHCGVNNQIEIHLNRRSRSVFVQNLNIHGVKAKQASQGFMIADV